MLIASQNGIHPAESAARGLHGRTTEESSAVEFAEGFWTYQDDSRE